VVVADLDRRRKALKTAMQNPKDTWSPNQYDRFKQERAQPFYDLAALVRPEKGMRIIDLGCGTGELTAHLAERFLEATVLGVDASESMLSRATSHSSERVKFERRNILDVDRFGSFDLVISNAALQWVPDNETLMDRILGDLAAGAQVAVQVPTNEAHPSHTIASAVAAESPFVELLGDFTRRSHVLALERYSELLFQHGFRDQLCIEKIYGHVLDSTDDVVEWVRGTLLTAYLSRLDAEAGEAFVDAYRKRLLEVLGTGSPYFYPFRRLLFWGRKADV
jgi:trans-aconitate 2-methyltransferase